MYVLKVIHMHFNDTLSLSFSRGTGAGYKAKKG